MTRAGDPPVRPEGTRVGTFEITGHLGAGGMGEVYRARDTKLGREVALKFLPAAFATDPDRLMRFEREARTLASLNHPHIAQVYGVEDGADTSGAATRALVMELVEGEDLSQRIARGPVPVDEALAIARQIADALEAAHEQGIIHRDLKPANIKVRDDGTVKVLDFGLAKALDAGPSTSHAPSPLLSSPTITSPAMTQAGIILGTAAYMAPEQAKGKPATKRSDIWAFGCVLYEMLTGRRAFDGEDISDTLANVLKTEAVWSALPPDVPTPVVSLLKRCLARDSTRRPAAASTVLFVLDEGSASSHEKGVATDTAAIEAAALALTGARQRLLWRVGPPLFLVALALGAALATWWHARPAASPSVTKFALTLPETAPATSTGRVGLALSPGGERFVYVSVGRLLLRQLDDFEAQPIPGVENGQGVSSPAFSPDGRSVAFYSSTEGVVRRVALGGGASVRVCPAEAPFGISWGSSGILVSQGAKGVLRCDLDGRAPETIFQPGEGEEAYGPQLLPDGKTLLISIARASDGPDRWDKGRVISVALPSGEPRTLLQGGSDARYLPSGHLVYALSGVVFAVRFDVERQQVTSDPVPVIEGVRRATFGITGSSQFSVSENGTLVYLPGPARPAAREFGLAIADRAGKVTPLTVPPGPYVHTRVSPDGKQLVVGTDTGNDAAVWIHRFGSDAPLRRLTLEGRNWFPIWSPDGQRVAFQSDRGTGPGIYAQRVDGTGAAEKLTSSSTDEEQIPESWSPDGRHLALEIVRGARHRLAVLSLDDKKVTPIDMAESVEPLGAVFSPDGKWIAYASSPLIGGGQSPKRGIFVQPFPPSGEVVQAPKKNLDFHPVWSRDGKELIFVPSAASGVVSVIPVETRRTATFGAPTEVPQRVMAERVSGAYRAYDVLPDGRFIGLVSTTETSLGLTRSSELRIVLNWFEELKQRSPTR